MDDSVNVDDREVAKFEALAAGWWDPQGAMRTLHDINPLRMEFIEARAPLSGRGILDVGCGGGILAESLAQRGARVTAIDASYAPLAVAKLHRHESRVEIDYRRMTAEQLADAEPMRYDVVTCMELLEHVPDPGSLVAACARLLRPGGDLFVSTLNRNPKSFLLAIVVGEHLLRLLPRGTHSYARFLRPSEVDEMARASGLRLLELKGLAYNPLTRRFRMSDDIDVNYLAWLRSHA